MIAESHNGSLLCFGQFPTIVKDESQDQVTGVSLSLFSSSSCPSFSFMADITTELLVCYNVCVIYGHKASCRAFRLPEAARGDDLESALRIRLPQLSDAEVQLFKVGASISIDNLLFCRANHPCEVW